MLKNKIKTLLLSVVIIATTFSYSTKVFAQENIYKDEIAYPISVTYDKSTSLPVQDYLMTKDNALNDNININNDTVTITLIDNELLSEIMAGTNVSSIKNIKIITKGNKEMCWEDYAYLKEVKIPNIDLSLAKTDKVWGNVFTADISNPNYWLQSIKLPEGVETIDVAAFYFCNGLKSIELPNTLQTIEEGAFDHSGLEYIKIPDSVKTIGSRAFTRCYSLQNISLGNSISNIASQAFSRCGLKSIELPNSVTSIESHAFWGCMELENVIVPNSIKDLDSEAFAQCSPDLNITIGINDINHFYSLINFIAYNNQENITLDIPYGVSLDIEDELLNGCNKAEIVLTLENGDIYNGGISNEKVYLDIPAQHKKDNIVVTKDGKPYVTPDKTEVGYVFYESGDYKVKVITDAYVTSEIEIIIVDKMQLNTLIETIESSDKFVEDKWTRESWNVLISALETAKSVLTNSNATQGEVDNAVNMLQHAIEKLERSADMNKDGKVDIKDLALVSKYYGQEKLEYDLNGDNIINEFEINYINNKILDKVK